jgi:hypothetical protein
MKLSRYIQIETRRQAQMERLFTTRIRQALKVQFESWKETGDIGNAMQATLSELYERFLLDGLQRQWQQFERGNITKRDRFFIPWQLWTKQYIQGELADKITNIDNTTRAEIAKVTTDAVAAGETITEIANRVDRAMNGAAGRARARMIGRTEAGEAINVAKAKSSDEWEAESGDRQGKIWINRGSKNPRDWHQYLDTGVPIPKDSPFIVTDPNTGITDEMQYPHDPSASAGNVINCGCQIVYLPLDD